MTKTKIVAALGAALIATPVLAADLPMKAPAPIGAAWSWAGWYAGVNLGYGASDPSVSENSSSPLTGTSFLSNNAATNADGIIGGAQIGYNWQSAPNWLAGIETDFQESAQKHTARFSSAGFTPTTDTVGVDIDWFGTVRGRVGYIVNNSNLWYVTGGYAYGRTELALTSTNFQFPGIVANGTTHKTSSGWTIAGGLESRLFGNWTGKVEFLYVDLGTVSGTATAFVAPGTPPSTAIFASAHIRDNVFRAGLNYKF